MSLWAANDAKGTLMALTLQYGSGGGKEFLVVSSKFLVRGEDWGKSDGGREISLCAGRRFRRAKAEEKIGLLRSK
jgi:hypothetical protein